MSCFPCFRSHRPKRSNSRGMEHTSAPPVGQEMKKQRPADTNAAGVEVDISKIKAKSFTFRELATATKNFRQECLLGEGGFGRVYKGTLQSSGQVVAVKQLDRNGTQGQKEFLGEILALSLLHHPNLVNLIGYCADGDQRLLVHEFIPGRTLEDRVLDNASGKMPLDWYTRIKIAYGTALGLEYLHEKANTPVIYRDLKASNILLDEEFNPKLSDVGLGRLGHDRDMMHGPSRLMGTYGFCAPEYSGTCEVTMKSDVYSYGVILLELITGRRAIDTTRANDEQNLVSWAQPLFRDPKKFPDMADPHLNKQFPEKDLNQAVAITAMCLQEEASARPFMSDVVTTLSFLSTSPPPPPGYIPTPVPADQNQDCNADSGSECVSEDDESNGQASDNESCSDNNHRDGSDNERNGRDLRQGDGEESKEWHSFERDESGSPGDQKSTSDLRNNGDQNNNSTQDNYGSTVPSRSSSGESNDECVSKSNSEVTEKKESTAVALDSGVSSTASSHQPIIKGYSKSLNYLDRTTSRRA